MRSFQRQVHETLAAIRNGYGCWCPADKKALMGHTDGCIAATWLFVDTAPVPPLATTRPLTEAV